MDLEKRENKDIAENAAERAEAASGYAAQDTALTEELSAAPAAETEQPSVVPGGSAEGVEAELTCGVEGESPAAEDAESAVPEKSETMAEVKPARKRRRWIWNIVLIALIGLGVYSLFGISGEISSEDGQSFSQVFSNIDALGVVILLCVILAIMTVDSLKFCIINKAVTGKFRVSTALKTHFLGKYYDGITPFSSGGQPMQIYYMTTKGVSGADSSAVVLIRYFASIFTFTLVGAAGMIAGVSIGTLDGVTGGAALIALGWVGLAVNLILPTFILLFVCFPRMAHKLTKGFINLGVKLKIVKNKEKVMIKATKTVSDFITSFRIIAAKPLHLVLLLLMCFAETILTFSVPYFVMQALSCNVDGMFLTVIILNIFTTFGVSFIPTPGNSGVIEGTGTLAFSAVTTGATLAWSVLFWRFATYYMYIIIGLVMTVVDFIIRNVRGRKRVKNEK